MSKTDGPIVPSNLFNSSSLPLNTILFSDMFLPIKFEDF